MRHGEGSERMGFCGRSPGDVEHLPAAHDERISDETAMTSPGHGFSAHDGCTIRRCDAHEFFKCIDELRSQHVVGIAAELIAAPAGVGRIAHCPAAAAQRLYVVVSDVHFSEIFAEGISVEVRVTTRSGIMPHIHERLDVVCAEQFDEGFQRPRRVADGPDTVLVIARSCGIVGMFSAGEHDVEVPGAGFLSVKSAVRICVSVDSWPCLLLRPCCWL